VKFNFLQEEQKFLTMHLQKSLTLGLTPSLPRIHTIEKRQRQKSNNRKSQEIGDLNYFLSSKNSRMSSEPDETSRFWEALKSISTKTEQKKVGRRPSPKKQNNLFSRELNSPKLASPTQIEQMNYLSTTNLHKEMTNSSLLYQAYYGSTKRQKERSPDKDKDKDQEGRQIVQQYLRGFKFHQKNDSELRVANKSLSQIPAQRSNSLEEEFDVSVMKKQNTVEFGEDNSPNKLKYISINQNRRKLYSLPGANENPSLVVDKKTGVMLYRPETGNALLQPPQKMKGMQTSKSRPKLSLPSNKNLTTEEEMRRSFQNSRFFTMKGVEEKPAFSSHKKNIDGSLFNCPDSLISPTTRKKSRNNGSKMRTPKVIQEKLKIETNIAIKEKLHEASFTKYFNNTDSGAVSKRSCLEGTLNNETTIKIVKNDYNERLKTKETNRLSTIRSPKASVPNIQVKISESIPRITQLLFNKEEKTQTQTQTQAQESVGSLKNLSRSNLHTSTTASLKISPLTNQTSPVPSQFGNTFFHFPNTQSIPQKRPKKTQHTVSSLNLEETRSILEKKLADQFGNEGNLEGWTLNTSHSYISHNNSETEQQQEQEDLEIKKHKSKHKVQYPKE